MRDIVHGVDEFPKASSRGAGRSQLRTGISRKQKPRNNTTSSQQGTLVGPKMKKVQAKAGRTGMFCWGTLVWFGLRSWGLFF